MIVTVTLNTAIDRTLFVRDFVWNHTIRSSRSVLGMGGKATDASWILSELGYANCALGFAAGATGRQMKKMLEARGGQTDLVWVDGETRTNIVVIGEKGQGQSTLVSGGLIIGPRHLAQFLRRYQGWLAQATCVLIGGSAPHAVDPSIYTQLVAMARDAGLPVVFDASGAGLHTGLAGCPTIAKPNRDELAELTGHPVFSLMDVYRAALELRARFHGTDFVITLGHQGALAVLQDRAYRIPVLDVPVVSTAGAGDGVLAGMCAALSARRSMEDGLRLGFAAAAAVCLTPATADCRRDDVHRFEAQIELIPYP